MKIVGMTDGQRRVLLLFTEKISPAWQQRALLLGRSVTILGELYLIDGQPVDAAGNRIPWAPAHREALAAWQGAKPTPWREFPLPNITELLSLR